MSMITRFKDIMTSNIHALLDKADDPEKIIAEYLRNLKKDLGKIKSETASVMAEEQRAKRQVDECRDEIEKMERYAVKATEAGDEGAARRFAERKVSLTSTILELQAAYQLAASKSQQMKQMHDKLIAEIGELEVER